MTLPGRALRYAHELRQRGLVRGTIQRTLDDLRRFGLEGPIRYALDLVGVETYMPIRYPGSAVRMRVRPTPFWKNWRMIESGSQDLESLRFLASFVKAGETILDVGAWEGPYALLFAELVGASGSVHAFEPDPMASAVLRANVRANALSNVYVEDSCLSNAEGDALFYHSDGGTIGTLLPNPTVAGFPRVVVRTTTIDRYCRDRVIGVSGIKVDVEGAEALVVEGARDVISKFSPWLFLEFHGMFMPQADRHRNWESITKDARGLTFVSGPSRRYRVGDTLDAYPDCDYFHVLVRF